MTEREQHQFESDAEDARVGHGGSGLSAFLPEASAAVDRRQVPAIDRRSVASHEAGHAVSARLLGLPVASATTAYLADLGVWGCTWADMERATVPVGDLVDQLAQLLPPDDRNTFAAEIQNLHHQTIMLLAGPICERMMTGNRLAGSEHDEQEAAHLARVVCRSPTPAVIESYLAFAGAEAFALLFEHRPQVEAVAELLEMHGTISGDDVDVAMAASNPGQ